MGKVILYLCGIALIIAFVVGSIQDLSQAWGWGLWGPVLGVVVLVAGVVAWQSVTGWRQGKHIMARMRLGALEAEAGMPLLTEGECSKCGKPLLAGAKFCSYCHTPTSRSARLCRKCGTRNAGDAEWRGECGERVLPVVLDVPKPPAIN